MDIFNQMCFITDIVVPYYTVTDIHKTQNQL